MSKMLFHRNIHKGTRKLHNNLQVNQGDHILMNKFKNNIRNLRMKRGLIVT